ncbi:hypothetical protein OK016_29155 [Vibrio chagasii]|nr:hypothetical protein [Vibrio chagasii]
MKSREDIEQLQKIAALSRKIPVLESVPLRPRSLAEETELIIIVTAYLVQQLVQIQCSYQPTVSFH